MEGAIGFAFGFVAGIVVTLVVVCIVAFDNNNEYLDYPPEEMEYGQETECEKDNGRDFR